MSGEVRTSTNTRPESKYVVCVDSS